MFKIIQIARQIARDHRAMTAIRQHPGDVYLRIVAAGGGRFHWECAIKQTDDFTHFADDPAKAVLQAIS